MAKGNYNVKVNRDKALKSKTRKRSVTTKGKLKYQMFPKFKRPAS